MTADPTVLKLKTVFQECHVLLSKVIEIEIKESAKNALFNYKS